MTKAELIGAVLLRVSGGYPNTDMKVQWDDVAFYVAPAVNYVLLGNYWDEKTQEEGDRSVNPLMLQVYDNLEVVWNGTKGASTIELPVRPVTVSRARSIQFIGTMKGVAFLPKDTSHGSMDEYYGCFKKKANVTGYEIDGKTIVLENEPPLLKRAKARILAAVDDLEDGDTINVPDGKGPELIQVLFELATGQRMVPTDTINDGQDHKEGRAS